MSYFRLYPSKNNTVFRYLDSYSSNSTFPSSIDPLIYPQNLVWSLKTNCGANPVMELQDGKGESVLLFGFELPIWLRDKLQSIPFTCNLKMFDAGTLFEPAIKLKNVILKYFTDDFVEGDGYSFLRQGALIGASNFLNRDSVNLWPATTFTNISNYHLNTINEDLLFDVTTSVQTAANLPNTHPKFALTIDNRENDLQQIYTKYIHSKYTRTIFKPYLEFFIEDVVVDGAYNFIAGEVNRIFLLNENGRDFTTPVEATIVDNGLNSSQQTAIRQNTGIYYIEITPTLPTSTKPEYYSIKWNIGGVDLYKQTVKVINPNQTNHDYDTRDLFFYPSSPYTHNIVRQGDIIPFEVISQIRGLGDVLNLNYEFRVLSMGEFEMIPWTPVSIYRNRMFFMLDTSYFFPEQNYEVFLRNKTTNYSITSNLTYKFNLRQDTQSHLRDMSASPYYSRDYFFAK